MSDQLIIGCPPRLGGIQQLRRQEGVGGQLNVYALSEMTSIYLLPLSTRGGCVVEKVQNSVYVVIECPLL